LIGGNRVELLIDAPANFAAWLAALRNARERILLENYIIRDDDVGREFRAVLVGRAEAGVRVSGKQGAVDLFAGYERVVDADPFAEVPRSWAFAGFRLVNK